MRNLDGICTDKKEQEQIENVFGIYVTGNMMKNYASCIKSDYSGPDKKSRYMYNKMNELISNSDKALKPIHKFLVDTQTDEHVEKMLILFHEVIDQIFEMDEYNINRVKQLIKKIKDGR